MSKTRKRHSTKAVQTPADEATSRGVEQLDLLVSPSDSFSQGDTEGDERRACEPQVSRNVPLSGRLGTSKRAFKDLSSISVLGGEAYEKIENGLNIGLFLHPSKGVEESSPDLEGLSLSEFDVKCMGWCRGSGSREGPAMWSPQYVDAIINRACAEGASLPHHSIKFLLRHGRVTDKEHGLLEKILSLNDLPLLCSYLQYVPDVKEASIVRCLEHIIHADFRAISSNFQPLVNCDFREQLLWHIFSLDVDLPCLRQALLSLPELDRMFCFKNLQKLLDSYLSTFTSSFEFPKTFKGLNMRLPSKHAACKWLAALLDSLYPAIVFDLSAEDALQRLRQGAEQDLRLSENYERVRNLLLPLMSNRKAQALPLERKSGASPTLYTVESVFF